MPVSFTPLTNHLLIELEPQPRRSQIIEEPMERAKLTRFAKVLSVGPEVRDVKPGDRIIASITAGQELPWGHLISESAVLSYVD